MKTENTTTKTLTNEQALEIAKIAEAFFRSAMSPWDFDDGYPTAEEISKDIMEDPEAVRNYFGDIVSENELDMYEIGLATDVLSALCKATGEEYFC